MKRYKVLISGTTVLANLNDYILLTNFKLENLLNTRHTTGFNQSFIDEITAVPSILSANLDTKSRFSNLVQLWLKTSL